MVQGYSDHLVNDLLDRFALRPGDTVIDAFCGSGTTLVECKKHNINAVGIDANPSSCFSARVKTNWNLNSARLLDLLSDLIMITGRGAKPGPDGRWHRNYYWRNWNCTWEWSEQDE